MQYFDSPAFGEWCKHVYGSDMKQMGVVTDEELEVFFKEVAVKPGSRILDVGCAAGYITAAIAAHYKSSAIGIDLNSDAIAHAKTVFSGNPALCFEVRDGTALSYDAETFDLINFFDTLYITQSIEKLRSLLDKSFTMLRPGGKLAVFWTNYPNKAFNIFETAGPAANDTQVALWGLDNHIDFKAIDLTQSQRQFWPKAFAELRTMESELRAEIPDYYKTLYDECEKFIPMCEKADAGGVYRWLFVFSKR